MSSYKSESTTSSPPRINWSIFQRQQSGNLYALALYDTETHDISGPQSNSSSNILDRSIGVDNGLTSRFFAFNVNPKSMNIEEPAAVTIVPTQDGQYVEHQGQIFKNIQLAGTTGLRPNKGIGSFELFSGLTINNSLSIQNPAIDDSTGLPKGERTGFDDLIALRNFIRHYWDLKRDNTVAYRTVMVWQNGKEGEWYEVEPMNFRTTRDSSSPLTFNYELSLRTIKRYTLNLKDHVKEKTSLQNAIQRAQTAARALSSGLQILQSLQGNFAALGVAVISGVLTPVNTILNNVNSVVGNFDRGQNAVSFLTKQMIDTTASNARNLQVTLNTLPSNPYVDTGITSQSAIGAAACRTIIRALNTIRGIDTFFSEPFSTTVAKKIQAYVDPITGAPKSGGSETDLSNIRAANAAGEAIVNTNEDIKMISNRLLGTSARWKELVILNSLRAPYIADDGDGTSILRPGDTILYPIISAANQTAVFPGATTKITGISSLDARLGTDIYLEDVSASAGVTLFDFSVDNNGDIESILGKENMGQAVVIKFATERGELPTHPGFGALFIIGRKATAASIVEFSINTRATILSDPRISEIASLKTTTDGNVLSVAATLLIEGSDDFLSLNFDRRS